MGRSFLGSALAVLIRVVQLNRYVVDPLDIHYYSFFFYILELRKYI